MEEIKKGDKYWIRYAYGLRVAKIKDIFWQNGTRLIKFEIPLGDGELTIFKRLTLQFYSVIEIEESFRRLIV